MRQAAREGAIDAGHDVTPDLMNAVRAIIRARDSGRPATELLNQTDMFGGEASSLAKGLVLNDRGQIASREQIASRLQRYATEASKNAAGPSLFGDKVTPADVLRTTLRNEGVEPEMASTAMRPEPRANWDASAAGRLQAASAATKARAQTFDQGPVGDVLRRGATASDYRLPNSAVPGKLFVPGPRGAETTQAYQTAGGSGAMDPFLDMAAESLRREAMTPDGILDPGKFARWRAKYQDALRAMPPTVGNRFANAAAASQAYGDAAAARKAAIDAYQKTAAGKFLGLSNPQDVTRTVGGIFGARNGVGQMRSLAQAFASNPEAQQGLRKAVADHILGIATGATEIRNLGDQQSQSFEAV